MDRKYIENWLDILKESWLNKNSNKVESLFTNTNFYQETPFLTPYTKYEEIAKEWENIDNQDIMKLESRTGCAPPHRTVSEACIIRNTTSFHNYTKKRNRLGTNL